MFDNLVVSSAHRRAGRTAKFFVCTSLTYFVVAASAFALSILLAHPKLADTELRVLLRLPPPPVYRPPIVSSTSQEATGSPRQDPANVMRLDDIVNHQQTAPPRIKLPSGVEFGASQGVVDGDQNGVPNGLGVIGFPTGEGRVNDAPPRPIDPPKAQTQTRAVDNKPLLVSSRVLQGKAIERVVPIYPELPKRIRLQGDVSIEVIISPNGQVESARVVSGHPMLINSALDAARRWRFEPTLLNNLPVRVTGVITFVFKVSD